MKKQTLPIKKQGAVAPKVPKTAVPPLPRKELGYRSSSQASSSQPEPIAAVDISHFVDNSERFRPRDAEKIVETWGLGEEALSKMPLANQPEALLSTLLPYQQQGLAWMLEKENPVLPSVGSKDIVQLWKRSDTRKDVFQNIATQFATIRAPHLAKGGILADDMGLGKTLQVISVILEGGVGTTLIVAPVSVMSNWAQQIERHVKKESSLKVMTYHSTRKRMTSRDFSEYNVVITSYGILSAEYLPRGRKQAEKVPRSEGLFSSKHFLSLFPLFAAFHLYHGRASKQVSSPSQKFGTESSFENGC